ncbi:hypothetical protein V8C37DRAFT_396709, partial [Trichoderma ceciliae]
MAARREAKQAAALEAARNRARAQRRERKAAEATHALEEKTVRIGNPKLANHVARDHRHEALVNLFSTNALYRALHLTVARLFAEQLHSDLVALQGPDTNAKRGISLCAKWAPSHGNFHDRHTCIISSIAEILYPRESLDSVVSASASRKVYLRHAREQYRKDVSVLRKHLEVVERDISANTFEKINYDRVPSVAMKNYTKLFAKKDLDRFRGYIGKVAEGKANISGAVLLPSTLVSSVSNFYVAPESEWQLLSPEQLVGRTVKEIEAKATDGQWKALVQRIKDSGTLSSCIAVCDVSGSMCSPIFKDKTTPMDSAIGLSLLVAEVAEPPFGGNFITFHSSPEIKPVDMAKAFHEKVQLIKGASWGMNTDFVAVFENLILPLAVRNNLKQEDMVKRVFVFSDMQFDAAERTHGYGKNQSIWSSSFERIKRKYEEHGYELPELVFWNLAGGRAGYHGAKGTGGDETAPKPVLAGEAGTVLVSGYSQGMLKLFVDNGLFDEEGEEDEGEEEGKEKGEEDKDEILVAQRKPAKRAKTNPLTLVKKAISHKGYDMLEVL